MLGHRTWNDGTCPVQLIDHHRWERSDLWTRFTRNTNIFRWDFMKQQIEFGEYPFRAPNNFDLFLMQHPTVSMEHKLDVDEAPRIRVLRPRRGQVLREPLILVEFEVEGIDLSASTFCLSVGLHQSICVRKVEEVRMAVHAAGCHVLHVLVYDEDFRLIAEEQVAFVQEVPAPVGQLGRLAGLLKVAIPPALLVLLAPSPSSFSSALTRSLPLVSPSLSFLFLTFVFSRYPRSVPPSCSPLSCSLHLHRCLIDNKTLSMMLRILAGAQEAATGRAKGEASSVRSGLEFDAVQ
eukprot:754733-Hanusia_phi.AAC.1